MQAYEAMAHHTASKRAPWYVVPADNKWFTWLVGAAAVIGTLASLDLHYPTVNASMRAELQTAREQLMAE